MEVSALALRESMSVWMKTGNQLAETHFPGKSSEPFLRNLLRPKLDMRSSVHMVIHHVHVCTYQIFLVLERKHSKALLCLLKSLKLNALCSLQSTHCPFSKMQCVCGVRLCVRLCVCLCGMMWYVGVCVCVCMCVYVCVAIPL